MEATLNLNIPVDVPNGYSLETLKKQVTEYAKSLIQKYKTETLSEDNLEQAFPTDLMQQIAEYAIKEHEAGHCIPNSQVKEKVMERLGWK